MSTDSEQYHVTIDFQSEAPDLTQSYSLIGLETAHPVMRIDRQVYQGTWAANIGTEMIFDEKGEWVTNVTKRLLMEKVEMVRRDAPKGKSVKPKLLRLEDLQDMKQDSNRPDGMESNSMGPISKESSVPRDNGSKANATFEHRRPVEDHEMTDAP